MRTVNMHEAKTQLSRLVARAAKGEGFIIAKAGKRRCRAASASWPARLLYPTISIAWARTRWTANSAAALDRPGGGLIRNQQLPVLSKAARSREMRAP